MRFTWLLAAAPLCVSFSPSPRTMPAAAAKALHAPPLLTMMSGDAAVDQAAVVSTMMSGDAAVDQAVVSDTVAGVAQSQAAVVSDTVAGVAQSLEGLRQQIDVSKLRTEIAERQYAQLKSQLELIQEKIAEDSAALAQAPSMAEQVQAVATAEPADVEQLRMLLAQSRLEATTAQLEAQAVATAPAPDAVAAPVAQAAAALQDVAEATAVPVPDVTAPVAQADLLPYFAGSDLAGSGAVLDPATIQTLADGTSQVAIKTTGEAIVASQVADAAGPDATPVLLLVATGAFLYRWSEMIKAVPKVSGEPAGQKIPSLASLAADANQKSTAAGGQSDGWQIVTGGLANLAEGTFDNPVDAFYAPAATAPPPSPPPVWSGGPYGGGEPVPSSASASAAAPVSSVVTTSRAQAAPHKGAKEVAKAAARAAAAAAEAAEPDAALADAERALRGVVTPTGEKSRGGKASRAGR